MNVLRSADYYLTTVLTNMQRPMESLRHKGSSGVPIWLEICVKSLKVLQLQGFPFVCQKTPTLKAAVRIQSGVPL